MVRSADPSGKTTACIANLPPFSFALLVVTKVGAAMLDAKAAGTDMPLRRIHKSLAESSTRQDWDQQEFSALLNQRQSSAPYYTGVRGCDRQPT